MSECTIVNESDLGVVVDWSGVRGGCHDEGELLIFYCQTRKVRFLNERCSVVGYKQTLTYVHVVLNITINTTND